MFFYEYCEIFKNTNFEKHLQTTASVNSRAVVFQEGLALPFKWNALTSGISWQNSYSNLVGIFTVLAVAPFLRTQSIMLGFFFILVASIVATWASLFSGHKFKLEAEDFIFHILQINFPNFGLKILILCSAKRLRKVFFFFFTYFVFSWYILFKV